MAIILKKPSMDRYFTFFRWKGQAFKRFTGFYRPEQYAGKDRILEVEKKSTPYRKALAFERAIREALVADRLEVVQGSKMRQDIPTVGRLVELFRGYAAPAVAAGMMREATATGVEHALRRILESARPGRGWDRHPLSVLSRRLVLDYQQAQLTAAGDPEAQARRATSVNSEIRTARQILSRRARDHYAEAGIQLPAEIDGFLTAAGLREARTGFRGIDPAAVKKIDALIGSLRDTQPDLYRAATLIRYLGMRNGAVLAARWDWIEVQSGIAYMVIRPRADYRPKTSYQVAIHPGVLDALVASRGGADTSGHIITPSDTRRRAGGQAHTVIYRLLSQLIRPHVHPEATKSTYELRKLVGSQVLLDSDSIETAAAFLGNSPEVCRRNYARYMGAAAMVPLSDSPSDR